MLFITEKAAEMVQLSAEASGCAGKPLRIRARLDDEGKICFNMGFDDRGEGDLVWESNGVSVLIRPEEEEHLKEVSLDYQDLPGGGPQFAFVTLKAAPPRPESSSCGGCSKRV